MILHSSPLPAHYPSKENLPYQSPWSCPTSFKLQGLRRDDGPSCLHPAILELRDQMSIHEQRSPLYNIGKQIGHVKKH